MGLLMSKVMAYFSGPQEKKMMIVGLDNAGKTTTLYHLMLGETVETTPTLGSNVEQVTYKNTKFLIWDIGGQDTLRKTWSTYYTNAHCVIFVIDSTDKDRMTLCKSELHTMFQNELLKQASLLVLANKQDMKDAMNAAELTELLALADFRDRPWHIQPTCALTGEGIFEGIDWIINLPQQKS